MTQVMLSASALDVSLPTASGFARILRGVDLGLEAGEVVDLVGPSGAGKSTLLRALARLLPDVGGALALAGRDASEIDAEAWRAQVTLVPQLPRMWPGTIAENLLLPWRLKVRSAEDAPSSEMLRAGLVEVGLDDVEPERDAARLSVGQQARVSLLRAALPRPRVLLLDEPDANLDDAAAEAVGRFVSRFAREGGGVLRVRHLPRGRPADRRLRLEAGRLTEVTGA